MHGIFGNMYKYYYVAFMTNHSLILLCLSCYVYNVFSHDAYISCYNSANYYLLGVNVPPPTLVLVVSQKTWQLSLMYHCTDVMSSSNIQYHFIVSVKTLVFKICLQL